jgi:hypothetical protein
MIKEKAIWLGDDFLVVHPEIQLAWSRAMDARCVEDFFHKKAEFKPRAGTPRSEFVQARRKGTTLSIPRGPQPKWPVTSARHSR